MNKCKNKYFGKKACHTYLTLNLLSWILMLTIVQHVFYGSVSLSMACNLGPHQQEVLRISLSLPLSLASAVIHLKLKVKKWTSSQLIKCYRFLCHPAIDEWVHWKIYKFYKTISVFEEIIWRHGIGHFFVCMVCCGIFNRQNAFWCLSKTNRHNQAAKQTGLVFFSVVQKSLKCA